MPRILVIDDDDAMRGLIKEHLSGTYEVVDTGVSENAFALALEHRPDAILLDLSMPGLSGFELCRALSSLTFTQHIPIFIISGADDRNQAFCWNLGASGYFTKPIDFGKVETALAGALHSKIPERRQDARISLRVTLKLKGKFRNGDYFEVRAATENVSKGGFLCSCTGSIEEATTVQVDLCAERELALGYARLVRTVKGDDLGPRYGFQFIGTSGAKILE